MRGSLATVPTGRRLRGVVSRQPSLGSARADQSRSSSFSIFSSNSARLAFDAQFRKGHDFQPLFADFHSAFGTDSVGAFVEPGQRFVDGLPPSISHFHERYAELTVQIHEGLIADITGRFEPPLLIFRQGLSQTAFDFLEDLVAFAQQHVLQRLRGVAPGLHAPLRIPSALRPTVTRPYLPASQ